MSHKPSKRLTISSLTSSSSYFVLVGVIIAKRPFRAFISKKDGSEKSVWSFTLRDSPVDYINVTAWGSSIYIEHISSTYNIGDVVDLINVKTMYKRDDERDGAFVPPVTSPLELIFDESSSEIWLHDPDDCDEYLRILHLPTKPHNNFLSLTDVTTSGRLLSGQHINLLVAIQRVGAVHDVKTKDGRDLRVLEIAVMDQTKSGFTVQTWEEDTIKRASTWKPRVTVLFLSDVRVEWNYYRKTMIATIGARSIVTENPSIREATLLAQFAQTAPTLPTDIIDSLANNMIHSDEIVNVMSCNAVLSKALSGESSENFTALVYATVHQFDLDGYRYVTTTKCASCGANVYLVCTNAECLGGASPKIETAFDLRLSLIDHTAQISSCRLTGNSATNVLKCTADEFESLSQEEKAALKWTLLLKKVAAKLVVLPAGPLRSAPLISIVAVQPVSLTQYSAKVPLY